MSNYKTNTKGFTLLEILLVIAIASSFVILMLNYTTQKFDESRRAKTVLQMQQILNAGLSFYINNSFWPLFGASITNTMCGTTTWTPLTALYSNYLPATLINDPYPASPPAAYVINCNNQANGGGFYVAAPISGRTPAIAAATARSIAGQLPLAYTTSALSPNPPTACMADACNIVIASVTVPGQNLNNARSINFAGVYHSGACVPAPNCPPGMKPSIFVTPVSASGLIASDPPLPAGCTATDPSTCATVHTYPITSFSAFARGVSVSNPVPSSQPVDCRITPPLSAAAPVNCILPGGEPIGTKYWRVCLAMMTSSGASYPDRVGHPANVQDQGLLMGSLMAVTRCVPNSGAESPAGSAITVYQENYDIYP